MHQQSGWTATPSRLIGDITSVIPTIFMEDALPYTTFPIYPGLGQALNMLACIPGGLVISHPPLHQIYTILTVQYNSDNFALEMVLINANMAAKTVFVSHTRWHID